jgi:hypothetical protein
MAARKPAKKQSVFQIKVTLRHVKPAVWRRLLVESEITLGELHFVLNEAMGWSCSHLHSFTAGKRTFHDPGLDSDGELSFEDERPVKLSSLVDVGGKFSYQYDFGDDWMHDIRVEKALAVDDRLTYPLCVGGARACPPEDCGGPGGYEHLLEALAKKRDPQHDDLLTWVGGYFDPEGFDANRTNSALSEMYQECQCGHCDCDDCDCDDRDSDPSASRH